MAAVRRLYIKQEYLDLYGYTQHCPKCQSIIVHGNEAKSTVPHSEQCRARIMAEVAKTEGEQEKLQKVIDESDCYYAEKSEREKHSLIDCRGGRLIAVNG